MNKETEKIKTRQQELSTVLWNHKIDSGYFRIGLSCSKIYQRAKPGQFVSLRLPKQTLPLLRRPFSIHRLIFEKNQFSGIEILYKIVGKFTQSLSQANEGDEIDLLGPLGHGFTVSKTYQKILFIAGGIGVAPLLFLAESTAQAGVNLKDSLICIGGKSRADILCKTDFNKLNIRVLTTTEDGSDGETGLVIAPVNGWLKDNQPDMIFACGPEPMLKAVIALAKLEKLPCEVSVETMMACGFGVCLGCAIQIAENPDKYMHACIDGPVFNAAKLISD